MGPLHPKPFVVDPLPTCPASVAAGAAGQVALVIDWQGVDTNRNHLQGGSFVTATAPVVFEQTDGTVPMSLSTRPAGALCALGSLDRESGSHAAIVTDRETVVFLRTGAIEVDLKGDEEGSFVEEPLYLRVHRPSAEARGAGAPASQP